jgi:GH43 family beta-xylosidase
MMVLWQNKYRLLIICVAQLLFLSFCGKKNTSAPTPITPTPKTFTNPLITGADPWVTQKDSVYYYLHTLGNRIAIWKTKFMTRLSTAPVTTVFSPTAGASNSANVWAPELHLLDGKWYIYYTAGAGADATQRTWVLENSNADPNTGSWVDKGRIFSADADFWAIDGSVLEHNGIRYFIWSGRPNLSVQNQNIYIAKMANPWTLETPTVMLTKPELGWEVNGGPVNEGPQMLKNKNGKLMIIYSASGCWTDDYALGMLTLKDGGNPLTATDWVKNQQPVFTKNVVNRAFGPGHNSFFISPDGKENWIIYHANSNSGEGCADKRNVRMQSFTWSAEGVPQFGIPVTLGLAVNSPSGE